MRVFVTGATGFVGSYLVPELLDAGHEVVGLSRSDAGAERLGGAGAEVVRGDLRDTELLRAAVRSVDGVVHAAFEHDFSDVRTHSENDRRVIAVFGEELAGSGRPLVVTSGTGLVRSRGGGPACEPDPHVASSEFPRAATEEAAEAALAGGACVVVVRLPQVHDLRHQGRLAEHVRLARATGRVAYARDGTNRLPAVHVGDAVRCYRLALERAEAGARYHAVAEEGVAMRAIAETLGAALGMPVVSLADDGEVAAYFGPLAPLVGLDLAASGAATRAALGWEPRGPGLLADLRRLDSATAT